MKKKRVMVWVAVAAFMVFSLGVAGAEDGPKKVKYPDGYRHWTHVKSMVIQEGHPLFEAFGGIHHIYANDKALKALKKGLPFPKDAVLVFDLLEAKADGKAIVEGSRKVLGVMQRDGKRFAATGGWGFEGFKGDTRERVVTDMKTCFGCHEPQKEKGYVFSTYRK
jgi:hypothetical protein